MATSLSRAQVKERDPITEIGTALSSRFLVLDPLTSIDGVIYYRAREYQEKKEVIIKVPIGDAAQKQVFRLESSAAARLTHKNILKQNGPEQLDDVLFSVLPMKPIAETLGSLLDRTGWLEVDDAIDIASQIAEALDYAHTLGVIHLELHPEHILITKDRTVLVSEFGVEETPELNWEHTIRSGRCPAQYQSPEQMEKMIVDHRSDLYSLGVVLFEMLTDRLPFDSIDADQIRIRRARQSPMVPHVLFPELPRMLSEIVLRLLESSPEKRFQTAAEVLYALKQLRQLPTREDLAIDEPSKIDAERAVNIEDLDTASPSSENTTQGQGQHIPSVTARETTTPLGAGATKPNRFIPYNGVRPAASNSAPVQSSATNKRGVDDPRSPYSNNSKPGKLPAASWILIAALVLVGVIVLFVYMNLTGVRGS
jgi:serine/threonine protein kinase